VIWVELSVWCASARLSGRVLYSVCKSSKIVRHGSSCYIVGSDSPHRRDNLYSPRNTVAAINKQKQQIGLYTYISIAWFSATVDYYRLSETIKGITDIFIVFAMWRQHATPVVKYMVRSAQASLTVRRHVDRFSRFCRAHGCAQQIDTDRSCRRCDADLHTSDYSCYLRDTGRRRSRIRILWI